MHMATQFQIDRELDLPPELALARREAQEADPRQGKRQKVFLPARLLAAGRTVPVHLLDLSKKGALVHADTPRMPGEIIWVLWNGIDILARIAWSRGNRFGVAFDVALTDGQIAQMVAATGSPHVLAQPRGRDWLSWFRK